MSETSEALDRATATAWTIGGMIHDDNTYEDQKAFQKDIMRSQMLYQSHQYNQSQVDNSIKALARQYSEAGFNPRDAVNRQGTANPTSAPSGMSAPQAPHYDTSPLMQSLQMMHDSRLDDVERALSASRLLTDDKQRDMLGKQAMKIMEDVLNDKKRISLQDVSVQMQAYRVYKGLELQAQDMKKKYEHYKDVLKETHNHNVAQEMTNMQNSLNIITGFLSTIANTFGFGEDSWLRDINEGLKQFNSEISGPREFWK